MAARERRGSLGFDSDIDWFLNEYPGLIGLRAMPLEPVIRGGAEDNERRRDEIRQRANAIGEAIICLSISDQFALRASHKARTPGQRQRWVDFGDLAALIVGPSAENMIDERAALDLVARSIKGEPVGSEARNAIVAHRAEAAKLAENAIRAFREMKADLRAHSRERARIKRASDFELLLKGGRP